MHTWLYCNVKPVLLFVGFSLAKLFIWLGLYHHLLLWNALDVTSSQRFHTDCDILWE